MLGDQVEQMKQLQEKLGAAEQTQDREFHKENFRDAIEEQGRLRLIVRDHKTRKRLPGSPAAARAG